MSYTVTLYSNSSNPNVMSKSITALATVTCEFKNTVDVENPEIYISAGSPYERCNYVYIPEFNRYYYAKCKAGIGNTVTIECMSDPLMSFKNAILNSPAVISRNPWHFDLYIPDGKLPIEARTVSATFKFPNADLFKGNNNTFILTTLGTPQVIEE